MVDITDIFNGQPYRPPLTVEIAPDEQLRLAMIDAGLEAPEVVYLDGEIHRFKSQPHDKEKNGWYVAYSDSLPSGRFGCWKIGVSVKWSAAPTNRTLSPAERLLQERRWAESKSAREKEREDRQRIASETVQSIWDSCSPAPDDHPYLTRKRVKANGARISAGDNRLVLPAYDENGELATLQFIHEDGKKLFYSGGSTKGKFWIIGDVTKTLYIAEGFATAASIHEATGQATCIAFNKGNILDVTKAMRDIFGFSQEIIIVADNDASGGGQKDAEVAGERFGAKVIIPPVEGDANDYVNAGHDLKELLMASKEEAWLIPADLFCSQPAPTKWLIKGWLPESKLTMVFGPSGGGKSFLVIDWCCHLASGSASWMGNKIKQQTGVVYLAGEGHHGMRGRVAAWKQHHQVKSLSMWISQSGCDLNTPLGYQKAADSIRLLDEPPKLIVVDTLHRFFDGDENSARDVKPMVDACGFLTLEFGCAVILVHHTGVANAERYRGSSAWKGALDMEYSISPDKDSGVISIENKKNKDGESGFKGYFQLQNIELPGWVDEDGEQVFSAIVVQSNDKNEPYENKKSDPHRIFSDAWYCSGKEIMDGKPFVTRSALLEYLISILGMSETTAKQRLAPSEKRFMGAIADGLEVVKNPPGYAVIDPAWATQMML